MPGIPVPCLCKNETTKSAAEYAQRNRPRWRTASSHARTPPEPPPEKRKPASFIHPRSAAAISSDRSLHSETRENSEHTRRRLSPSKPRCLRPELRSRLRCWRGTSASPDSSRGRTARQPPAWHGALTRGEGWRRSGWNSSLAARCWLLRWHVLVCKWETTLFKTTTIQKRKQN